MKQSPSFRIVDFSDEREDSPNVTLAAARFLQRYEPQNRVYTLQIYRLANSGFNQYMIGHLNHWLKVVFEH